MCTVQLVLVAVVASVLCAVGSCQRIHYWDLLFLNPSGVAKDPPGAVGKA